MLRSNSKQAKENIRVYIIQNTMCDDIDLYIYPYLANYTHRVEGTIYEDGRGRRADLFSMCAAYIYNAAWDQVIKHDYSFRKNGSTDYCAAFEYWLSGLPSEFTSEYYNRPIARDIVAGLLEETEAEKDRYTEQQAEKYLSNLIYREISQEVRRQVKAMMEDKKHE